MLLNSVKMKIDSGYAGKPLALPRPAKSKVFGNGVQSFSRVIAPVHVSLSSMDISQLFSHLEDKFQTFDDIEFKAVQSEVDEIAGRTGLDLKLVLVSLRDEGTLPGLEKVQILKPLLVGKDFDPMSGQKINVIVEGENIASWLLDSKRVDLAALANEGRTGLDIMRPAETKPYNITLKGQAINEDIVIGRAVVIKNDHLTLDQYPSLDLNEEAKKLGISFEEMLEEQIRVTSDAFDKAIEEFKKGSSPSMELLGMMMGGFKSKALDIMNEKEVCASDAMKIALKDFEHLKQNPDEKQRSLYYDFYGFLGEVLSIKHNKAIDIEEAVVASGENHIILVAHDIPLNRMGVLALDQLKGVIREKGSITDHISIRATEEGMGGIVGVKGAIDQVKDGDLVAIDGNSGEFIIRLNIQKHNELTAVIGSIATIMHKLRELRNIQIKAEGVDYLIMANVGYEKDAVGAFNAAYDGVNLVRTEIFLATSDDGAPRESEPTIMEQVAFYNRVIAAMRGKPVTFRTIDPDTDKPISYLDMNGSPLGVHNKGLSICLEKGSPLYFIFRNQLEAFMRTKGKFRVMFPVVRKKEELDQAFELIESIKKELAEQGIEANDKIEYGVMIEHTAILNDLKDIAADPRVKFFSIGTNDLIADIANIERTSSLASKMLNELDPRMISTMIKIIKDLEGSGKVVSICGNMPNDWKKLLTLKAMGYNKMSFMPTMADIARKLILATKKQDLAVMLENILKLRSAKEIERYIEEFTREMIKDKKWDLGDIYPILFPNEDNR